MGDNAAAGALIEASSRIQIILALIEGVWGCVARLSAACCVERASPHADPADNKLLFNPA